MFRVARWYIFKQKIQIWVNFGGSCNRRYWYMYVYFFHLVFFVHLPYFMDIRYISWLFGNFFLLLLCCSTKNLATLINFWHRESSATSNFPYKCMYTKLSMCMKIVGRLGFTLKNRFLFDTFSF
jgi:hypothetical protein